MEDSVTIPNSEFVALMCEAAVRLEDWPPEQWKDLIPSLTPQCRKRLNEVGQRVLDLASDLAEHGAQGGG